MTKNRMNNKKTLLTAKQVSEYFNIPLRTVHRLSKNGTIKSYKIGGQWRYIREDIEKYGSKIVTGKKTNFLTAEEVSKFLNIPLRTLYRLSKQGKIRAFKIGDKWRYNKSDIEKYGLTDTDFSKESIRRPPSFRSTWQNKVKGVLFERRTHPRINCFIPCHIKVIIPQKREVFTQARILNISEGGLFIENCENEDVFLNIRNDDPIDLEFELTKWGELKANGRVLRTHDGGVAVKFRDISRDTKEKISRYVG